MPRCLPVRKTPTTGLLGFNLPYSRRPGQPRGSTWRDYVGRCRLGVLAALAAGCCVLAGCSSSSSSSIPTNQADALLAQLDSVGQQVSTGSCANAKAQNLPKLEQAVANLPSGVSTQIRQSLADGTTYLRNLVNTQCQPPPSATAQANPATQAITRSQTQRKPPPPPPSPMQTTPAPPPEPTPTDHADTSTSDQGNIGHGAKGKHH
jgi:hypothetical protein